MGKAIQGRRKRCLRKAAGISLMTLIGLIQAVITQEEYDTLDAARQAAKPEQSANGESGAVTSEGSSTETASAEETGNL